MGKFIAGIYFSDCIKCGRPRAKNPNSPCGPCVASEAERARQERLRKPSWPELMMWGVTILAFLAVLLGTLVAYGPKITYTAHWFN